MKLESKELPDEQLTMSDEGRIREEKRGYGGGLRRQTKSMARRDCRTRRAVRKQPEERERSKEGQHGSVNVLKLYCEDARKAQILGAGQTGSPPTKAANICIDYFMPCSKTKRDHNSFSSLVKSIYIMLFPRPRSTSLDFCVRRSFPPSKLFILEWPSIV